MKKCCKCGKEVESGYIICGDCLKSEKIADDLKEPVRYGSNLCCKAASLKEAERLMKNQMMETLFSLCKAGKRYEFSYYFGVKPEIRHYDEPSDELKITWRINIYKGDVQENEQRKPEPLIP